MAKIVTCVRSDNQVRFAPVFHPSFRFAGVPRRELGLRTVFNVLGPLCNPAGARYQALGVADVTVAGKMADVLIRLGVERAIVFHAGDGMDELSVSGPSHVIEIKVVRKQIFWIGRVELPKSIQHKPRIVGSDSYLHLSGLEKSTECSLR